MNSPSDGPLVTPVEQQGTAGERVDGLPVLSVGRPVTNDEVLSAIGQERADR